MTTLPEPEPDEDSPQDALLREHLQRAHEATELAREAIEQIAEELRFPLAFSTRVREEPRAKHLAD